MSDHPDHTLSHLSNYLLQAFEKEELPNGEKKLSVNPVVSKVAAWYEKLRNAMEYGEEAVVLRAAIERILKRRLILNRSGEKIALPLIRELLWAKYFPDGSIPESVVNKVANSIDDHLHLRDLVVDKHGMDEGKLNDFIYDLISCDIARILYPDPIKDAMTNYMFQVMRKTVVIEDEPEQIRDVQVYIAVLRNFARVDRPLLRYHLFNQYFGKLHNENVGHIAASFMKGYHEIERELAYKYKERIFSFIKSQTPVFLILQATLLANKDQVRALVTDQKALANAVIQTCTIKYQSIGQKIRTAIIRSIIFILLTKVIFAFLVEGSYEKYRFGHIMYTTLAINTIIPPLLMVAVAFFIRTPGMDNSKRIFAKITTILYNEHPVLLSPLTLSKKPKPKSTMDYIFTFLWLLGFLISFGGIWLILGKLQFNYMSRFVFMFFVAIVSFLSYRINQTAQMYAVERKQGLLTPVIDFFFLPIIQVGRRLTEGVSQINVLLFFFDYIFEMPFKGIFAFSEQWFHFLHSKRENLE